jgi:hypothetical protein
LRRSVDGIAKRGHFLMLRQDLGRCPGRDLYRLPSLTFRESPDHSRAGCKLALGPFGVRNVAQIFNLLYRRFLTGEVCAVGCDANSWAVEGSAD